jgi:hypothetical protein
MRHALLVFSVMVTFIGAGAWAKQVLEPKNNQASVKGVVTLTVDWIKDKKSKFDLHILIHNEQSNSGIIVFLGSMGCGRGALNGQLKHTFFNTGEKTIDFRPNQTKEFTLVCQLPSATKGIYKINLGKIWDNPTLDGKTTGKSLADDLVFSQVDE